MVLVFLKFRRCRRPGLVLPFFASALGLLFLRCQGVDFLSSQGQGQGGRLVLGSNRFRFALGPDALSVGSQGGDHKMVNQGDHRVRNTRGGERRIPRAPPPNLILFSLHLSFPPPSTTRGRHPRMNRLFGDRSTPSLPAFIRFSARSFITLQTHSKTDPKGWLFSTSFGFLCPRL